MVKIFKSKVIIVLILLIIFFVTGVMVLRSRNLTEEETEISNNLIEDDVDIDDSVEDIIDSLSNTIINNKYEKIMEDNSIYTEDLEARNNVIAEEYGRAVKLFNVFANENSLNLTYVEPIEDRISRFEGSAEGQISMLLQKLSDLGAETVNYFTDEEGLNIDLSIGNRDVVLAETMINIGMTYSDILYKASIENIDSSFKFSTSKLNEFRSMITNDSSLNYDLVDDYISKVISGEYSKESAYLNKIDKNIYESIIVNKNTCYYKMVYNPLL